MLKQAIDWKSKPLLDFIRSVSDLVDAQFKDLRRALMGNGDFERSVLVTERSVLVSQSGLPKPAKSVTDCSIAFESIK